MSSAANDTPHVTAAFRRKVLYDQPLALVGRADGPPHPFVLPDFLGKVPLAGSVPLLQSRQDSINLRSSERPHASSEETSATRRPISRLHLPCEVGRPSGRGITNVSALKRTTEVVEYREGANTGATRKLPGVTGFEPITLERGITHDADFETWARLVAGTAEPLLAFRKEVRIEVYDAHGHLALAYNVHGAGHRNTWRLAGSRPARTARSSNR